MNGSADGGDGGSLDRIEQALLADDPAFVRRLRHACARLPAAEAVPAPLPPVELRALLGAVWGVFAALALLALSAGSLVGASGTCVLALLLHRQTRRPTPAPGAAPPRRVPGRSASAGE